MVSKLLAIGDLSASCPRVLGEIPVQNIVNILVNTLLYIL